MAPKSVTFRRHDHLVSVLFGDLLSHSYNITFSMFLYLVVSTFGTFSQRLRLVYRFSVHTKVCKLFLLSDSFSAKSFLYFV